MKKLSRRHFMGASLAASVGLQGVTTAQTEAAEARTGHERFKLKYAPGLGTFNAHAGGDPIDNLEFIADQGFRAFFDNGLMRKPKDQQEAIAASCQRLGLDIGPFVMYADFKKQSLVTRDKEVRPMLKRVIEQALDTYKRTGCQWALLVPGAYNQRTSWDYQTANIIDHLRYCAELLEPHGLIMVLEPLNKHNHPGLILQTIPQAYQICKAVNSPCIKIVDDFYHQQITEGNLIPNVDMAWDQIAAFHIGDNPGRKEPTTGEINYRNIFKHLHKKKFDGVLCMEHGRSQKGKAGEQALIRAYRYCDDF